MLEEYIRNKITQLRIAKGLSEYQLSYNLGHSRGYINNITSGKTLPSLREFIGICEYFEITPYDFFYSESANPHTLNVAISELKKLSEDDLILIVALLTKLNK